MATPQPGPEEIFLPGGQICKESVTGPALTVLQEALKLARVTRWDSVRSPHIFMGLLAVPDPGVRLWGDRLGADLGRLLRDFQELFHQEEGECEALLMLNREFLSDNVIRLLREAHARALDHHRAAVTPMDLLITLLTTSNSIVAECFERSNIATAAKLTEWAVLAEQQSGAK
jgi:ATP-dependent Clp protease ATP-binding subunit ClpA